LKCPLVLCEYEAAEAEATQVVVESKPSHSELKWLKTCIQFLVFGILIAWGVWQPQSIVFWSTIAVMIASSLIYLLVHNIMKTILVQVALGLIGTGCWGGRSSIFRETTIGEQLKREAWGYEIFGQSEIASIVFVVLGVGVLLYLYNQRDK
jgi:hypothetical protein